MTAPMATADRRLVLVVAGAAVVWRWLIAQRTPLPGIDACLELWRAERLAAGSFGDLAAAWWPPWWSLLLAPAVACGASPFASAQIAACVCGALTVVVVALAAERLREGAGLPAAVLAMAGAGASVAAGAGSAATLGAFWVGLGAWAVAGRRNAMAVVCWAIAAAGVGERIVAVETGWRHLRLGVGVGTPLALLAWLPPRPGRASLVWPALGVAIVASVLVPGAAAWLPAWAPAGAVLGGVGLARLPGRWRDVLLCVVVALESLTAWHEIEPREAIAERIVGRYLAHRLTAAERVVSDLPRVSWAAHQRPEAPAPAALLAAAADPAVAAVVLGRALAADATLTASLAGVFVRHDLPADLADLAAEHGLLVWLRRRRP